MARRRYLLYVSRNGPRPFGAEITEIATIFASYLGTALENAELYHELRRQAARDPLTGLANRERARQRLEHVLTAVQSPYIGLLFCDLDGFKAVNDRLGHEAGDELLQAGRGPAADGASLRRPARPLRR